MDIVSDVIHRFHFAKNFLMTYQALWQALAASLLATCSSTASLTDAELPHAAKQGDGRAKYKLAKRLATLPDYPNAMHWILRQCGYPLFAVFGGGRSGSKLPYTSLANASNVGSFGLFCSCSWILR